MKIVLSPEIERQISEKLETGRYHSADEIVREGLELLAQREKNAPQAQSADSPNLAAAIEQISSAVPEKDWQSVPSDLSQNLDSYLYNRKQ